jgi:class 3 adenylate cyclase/predicted ATPase/MoxR-like ATPase
VISSQPAGSVEEPLPTPGSTPESPSQPPTATVFGRYEVRRTLGKGGFGEVYLGHDTQLDRPVAIKVMRGESAQLLAVGEQSMREARKLARLRHPGIVTVYDVGAHEGKVYIVSDYLEGVALSRWLRDNRPSWRESARIVAAVADALAHAHARLIVHRDVKPDNIMLTADRTPVLVDFGLALDEDQAAGGEKGLVSGTPLYMSPEQALGTAHRIDGRTDVYSLGVVLYELLTGRLPFRANTLRELLRQVCEDEPQPPRQLAPEIPPDLERACLKTLAKRQQDRYTTAGDFAEDLRRVLQTEPGPSVSRQTPAEYRIDRPTSTLPTVGPEMSTPTSIRRAREAERRQLTVLVCGCDLFDSEAYLELDAEDQTRVLHEFQEACQHAVQPLGGTVVQCNEKGLLACFGFPVAFEDSAVRAARTGLDLLDGMKILGERFRRDKLDLNPWIGIHTGPAIVEFKDGVVSLVGDARNVAVRLDELAATGQVVCTEASHRLLQGQLQCSSLGRKKVKGVAQPVELFLIEKIAPAGDRFEAVSPVELSPLTGRDQEIGLLRERWEQAQEGMGQVVLLVGEPGLGKSRLVYAMKQHVLGQMVEGEVDAPVIEWRCSPHFQNTGLYPAIDFYERALGFGPEEPPQDRFDRLLYRLGCYDLARPETVPLWTSLLSLPTPDRFPPLSLSPVRKREETFRTILDWLHTRAARKPVLFVIEDLHWVDASTLEFLGQFLAEGLHDSILTVLTFRPEFKPPWQAVAQQTTLALNRLTRRQVGDLMRKKVESTLPETVIEQIYSRTSGVPLFVEEFTKMVQESGALDRGQEGEALKTMLKREIPATLQDLMMARLDRMEGEREVAQLAATLGREFRYELLAAAAMVDEPVLQAELAKLVQAEVLYAKGKLPDCSYIFKHALLEDAAYNSLVKGKRQQFHKRIAEVLEAQFSQTAEARPELLAHHFTEAGLAEKAAAYWLKAGLRSRDRSANVEAIGHLTKGLALVGTFAESTGRDAQELQFQATLGPAYIAARGYAAPEVGPILHRALELCRGINNPRQLLGIMLGIWEWRIVRGDLRVCVDLAAEVMELAQRVGDPGMLMEALFMPGVTMFYRAEFAGARAHFENALASYEDAEQTKFWTAYTGHNASVTHRCYLALTLWHLGYPDQALNLEREMRELARALGHPFSLGHGLDFGAFLYNYCRLGAGMLKVAEEEMALGKEQGFPLWHALGTLHVGGAMLLEGRRAEGVSLLLKGLSAFRATGAEIRVPCYLGMVAEEYTLAGRFEEAREALNEAFSVGEKNDNRTHEAELHRLKGELHRAETNDHAAAEECFRTAIETARRQQSKAWELRATTSLARLWQGQGRNVEAREALTAVYAAYTEGFTTPDLVESKALLEELGRDAGSRASTGI